MSFSKSEEILYGRLEDFENSLLRKEVLDTGKILELIYDLKEELTDCWNIIAYHEGRR